LPKRDSNYTGTIVSESDQNRGQVLLLGYLFSSQNHRERVIKLSWGDVHDSRRKADKLRLVQESQLKLVTQELMVRKYGDLKHSKPCPVVAMDGALDSVFSLGRTLQHCLKVMRHQETGHWLPKVDRRRL